MTKSIEQLNDERRRRMRAEKKTDIKVVIPQRVQAALRIHKMLTGKSNSDLVVELITTYLETKYPDIMKRVEGL